MMLLITLCFESTLELTFRSGMTRVSLAPAEDREREVVRPYYSNAE